MSEPSDEEIRRFMEKYYPEYADNLELGRILYKRFMKRRRHTGGGARYEEYKIGELQPRMRVVVQGVVIEVFEPFEYEGCAVCRRRKCNNPNHRGRKVWVVDGFKVSDGTGTVFCSYIHGKDEEGVDVEEGDVVRVYGFTKLYKNDVEITADKVEIVRKHPDIQEENGSETETGSATEPVHTGSAVSGNIDEESLRNFLEAIDMFGKLKKSLVPQILQRYGLRWEDVSDYLEVIVEDGEEWVRLKKTR